MIPSSGSLASPDPAETASALQLLAEALDQRAFFAALRELLPRLLPATRVDILTNEPSENDCFFLASGGEPSEPPPPEKRTPDGFVEWLGSQGYSAVLRLPLTAAGRQLGWLLLARRHSAIEAEPAALA